MQFVKILAECQRLRFQTILNEDGSDLEYGVLLFTARIRLPCCFHLEDPTNPKIFVLRET
jgi:hypothetical protein